MNKKLIVVLIMFLLLFSLNIDASESEASKTIKMAAYIPAFQELEVIEPIYVENLYNRFNDKSSKEPVIISQAGKIRIKSNTHWRLELKLTSLLENFNIKIKESQSSVWKDVSKGATNFSGENGDHLLNFDLKLIPKKDIKLNSEKRSINFSYALLVI